MWWEINNHRPITGEDEDQIEPLVLLCDNQAARSVSKNIADHQVMKYVDLREKWIQQRIELGHFKVDYVQTRDQLADIFTKALSRIHFEKLRELYGVVDPSNV